MLVQTSSTPEPVTIVCLGDSQTMALTYGVYPTEYYPHQLQVLGYEQGYAIDAVNCGNSGWTTSTSTSSPFGLRSILQDRLDYFNPRILVFYAGVNDAGNGINAAATQANIEAVVATAMDSGLDYVLIVNTNYLNYSSGGDNAAGGTYYTPYVTLRAAQLAAYTSSVALYPNKVGYCDSFTYQKNKVLAGDSGWVQGTYGSLITDSNQHMNSVGQLATAEAVLASLISGGALDAYKIG